MAIKKKHKLTFDAWEEEKCLWDVNSSLYKIRLEKAKSLKKLADQFTVTGEYFFICRQQNILFCILLISFHFIRNFVFPWNEPRQCACMKHEFKL